MISTGTILDAVIDRLWSVCPPYLLTVAIVVLLGAVAARLLWLAVRGRPELALPRCAACEHPATPPHPDRCSECGACFGGDAGAGSRGLAFGERRRSWRCGFAAVACIGVATLVGAVYPLHAEALVERLLLAAALQAGCRGQTVLGGLARSIDSRLGGAAIEERLVDELLSSLGREAQEHLTASPSLWAAYAKLGQQCIDRGARNCTAELAKAGLPSPAFHLRRRWRSGDQIRIEIQNGARGYGGATEFMPGIFVDRVLLDGQLATFNETRHGSVAQVVVYQHGPVPHAGERHLEIRWRQQIGPTPKPTPRPWTGSITLDARGWSRSGSFEATLELVEPTVPLIDPTDAPRHDPWCGDRGGPLLHLRLRDVDERMLVECGIRRRVVKGVAVAGRWHVVQDGIDRPLHQERPWPNVDPRIRAGMEFTVAGQSLIQPRVDPGRPFMLRFVPDPALAAPSSDARYWSGETTMWVQPESLSRVEGTADPTWEWRLAGW